MFSPRCSQRPTMGVWLALFGLKPWHSVVIIQVMANHFAAHSILPTPPLLRIRIEKIYLLTLKGQEVRDGKGQLVQQGRDWQLCNCTRSRRVQQRDLNIPRPWTSQGCQDPISLLLAGRAPTQGHPAGSHEASIS